MPTRFAKILLTLPQSLRGQPPLPASRPGGISIFGDSSDGMVRAIEMHKCLSRKEFR